MPATPLVGGKFGLNEKRFMSINDLVNQKPPNWLVEGLFEQGSLVMLAGPPGHYKSFKALDWILSMAAGRPAEGRKTIQSRVLYLLGEGKANLVRRIGAWIQYHKLTERELSDLEANFRVSFDVPQLALKYSVDNMLAGLEAEDYQPNVIVIDTFARSFVGLDENSQKDTGMWVEQADRLRQLGYTVIFLHHTAKNTEFGVKYRGSTAIMGAMDTAMTLVKKSSTSDLVTLTITKQKDHSEGDPLTYKRVEFSDGVEGESMILVPIAKVDERFTPQSIEIDEAIKELIKEPFESDSQRARLLAQQFNLNENAARVRISRRRKEMEEVEELNALMEQHRKPAEEPPNA